MRWKPSVLAVVVTLAACAVGFGPQAIGVAHAGCAPEEKIDSSTADQARKKIEAAGFREVRELKKSCDNYWHGKAIKDGAQVRIVLSPQGQVQTEGD
jgi:hypothetical protein